jgi:hypothetical protein
VAGLGFGLSRKLGGIQIPKVMDRYFSYGSDGAKSTPAQ